MEGPNNNVISEVIPDDIQTIANQVEHKSFRLTGGWKLCIRNKKQNKQITLKQAFFEGVVVDLFLLLVTSLVMDGGFIFCITSYNVIAHLSASTYWALRSKGKVSASGIAFIQGGILFLLLITIVSKFLIFAVFEAMNIEWYL